MHHLSSVVFLCLFSSDRAVLVSLRLYWMAFPVWAAKLMVWLWITKLEFIELNYKSSSKVVLHSHSFLDYMYSLLWQYKGWWIALLIISMGVCFSLRLWSGHHTPAALYGVLLQHARLLRQSHCWGLLPKTLTGFPSAHPERKRDIKQQALMMMIISSINCFPICIAKGLKPHRWSEEASAGWSQWHRRIEDERNGGVSSLWTTGGAFEWRQ